MSGIKRLAVTAVATSCALLATACGAAEGDPGAGEVSHSAQSASVPSSIAACVQRLAGSASPTKKDVTLTVITHDKGAMDALTASAKQISSLPGSPYNYELTPTLAGVTDVTVKVQAALQTGKNIPDIVGIEETQWPTYYKTMTSSFTDLTKALGPLKDEILPARVAEYSYQGGIYGVETTYPVTVYWYNATELQKLGVDVSTIKTWDDLFAAGISKALPAGKYLLAVPADWRGTSIFALQNGGGLFDKDGKPTLTDPATIAAAELLQKGIESKAVKGFSTGDFFGAPNFAALENKEILGYAMPDWWLGLLKAVAPDQSGEWRAVPLPVFKAGGLNTSLNGGHAWTVPAAGSNVDAATMLVTCGAATAESQVLKYKIATQLPTNLTALGSPELRNYTDAYVGGQNIGELFATLRENAPTFYISPALPVAVNEINSAFGDAYAGRSTVADAAAKAQAAIAAELGQ
jgi:ABC-type glycerol-3-phosphate transport system substrate-binding protein